MNQAKTTKARMSCASVIAALATGLVVFTSGAMAQEKLGDLVTEGGFDWIIGAWTATTDQGDKIDLAYKWELDKHMLSVNLKWPNYEYRGMIFYVPAEDKIIQVGVDNRGGNGKGLWQAEGSKAVHKYEHTGADGQTNKMGMVHSRVNDDTMKVEVYEISGDGTLGQSPAMTTEYKRQKEQTPQKAQGKAAEAMKSIAEQEAETMKIAESKLAR
jgi:hypothetical protein